MKLSVITVCYNSEKYLKDCIKSVNIQKLDDIEHIFIDGNSSDCTLEIIKKTSKRKPVLISEPDNGIYDAMNKGLKHAQGELICFLNSDDFFASDDALTVIFDAFKKSNKQVIWGDVNVVNQKNTSQVLRQARRGILYKKDILAGTIPPHPSFFISKSILNAIGQYDLKYEVASDFDFMKRSLMHVKYDGLYVNKLTTLMRSGGLTNSSFSTILKGNLEIIDSLMSTYKEFNLLKFIFFRPIRMFWEKLFK